MDQVTSSVYTAIAKSKASPPSRHPQAVYGPIHAEMQAVEFTLRRELRSRYEALDAILEHGVLLGGKRLRPALTLLSGAAAGNLVPGHITLATVMEMIHTATLVHDDVLDRAEKRRHVDTVNHRWNSDCSILLGDFLFAHSYYLASTLGDSAVCQAIGAAARRVCEGELLQVISAGNLQLSESEYLAQIEGKTAELTRVSCEMGAKLSQADSDTIVALGDYGRFLGIAFQIADDLLDIWGDDTRVGKTLGNDLAQAKATLPIIRALEVDDESLKNTLLDAVGAGQISLQRLRELLAHTDAQAYARSMAERYVQQAEQALAGLEPSAARDSLLRIARFAVSRSS